MQISECLLRLSRTVPAARTWTSAMRVATTTLLSRACKTRFQVALQGPRVNDYMSGVSRVIQLRIFVGGGLLVVSVLSHRTRRIARPASEFSLQLLAFPAASTPAGRSFPDHNPSSAKKTNQKRPLPATFVRMPLPLERCGSL